MKKILAWLKYLLPLGIILFFKKSKASTESFTYFLSPTTAKQKDDFLLAAKRPDWNDDDCLSAKVFATELLTPLGASDLATLPSYYLALLDDATLNDRLQFFSAISTRLSDEASRRAGV